MKKYSALLVLVACLACSTDNTDPQSTDLDATCAYDSRKTVGTLVSQQGTIKVTPAGSDTWTDIYVDGNATRPYCACNLPLSFAEDGFRIVFSAEIKETYANEKWRCQPIKLTTLTPLNKPGK